MMKFELRDPFKTGALIPIWEDPILHLRIIEELKEVAKMSNYNVTELKEIIKSKIKQKKEIEKNKILKDKKTKKKINKEKDVIGKENTTTSILPTTPYYIKSWGMYNKYKKLIIEQITPHYFLYNLNGKKGIIQVQDFKISDKVTKKGFILEGVWYLFQKTIYPASKFYNIPSLQKCQEYIKGKIKVRDYCEIEKDIQNVLKQMFDFSGEIDVKISSLAIGESWIKPLLNEFFFFGIDSTKGGGKTTLGEIIYFLMRHGFLGGDISSASIPRLIDELDLNIFVDEIDQNRKGDDDTMGILRKGQRRNNPYVRCEGRDNHPVIYDIAGCHGFSFRSQVEDAFMDRALRTHTTKSANYMLPVINSSKREILKPLADELFFWFIENISVVGCSKERGVVVKSRPTTLFSKNLFNREEIYNLLTNNLSKDELDFLQKVFGRDNELTFLCLKTAKLLGFDMLKDIKQIMKKKKSDESSSEGFYLESLKEYIILNKETFLEKRLSDGDNAGDSFWFLCSWKEMAYR